MTANVGTGSGHVMANANYPSHHSESILGILSMGGFLKILKDLPRKCTSR